MTPTSASNAAGASKAARAIAHLLAPVDAAWLAAFRVFYGVVLAVSMLRFVGYGWVDRIFVDPAFHFKYWGFEWVEPLPAPLLHAVFVLLFVLALAIAAGFAFRLSATLFALGLTYVQLLDVTIYLNHYYLASLLGFLLAASPAHRAFSLDAWLSTRVRRDLGETPKPGWDARVARAWLYLFRFQVGVVYTFAGLAKAQSDWLVHAQPLRIWLGAETDLPILGPLFTLPFVPHVFAWCGFLFDTTIVFFLLARRTRPWAYAVVIVFHTLTRLLFPIGMFPLIMVMSALVFFSPSWPRRAFATIRGLILRRSPARSFPVPAPDAARPGLSARPALLARAGLALAGTYCLVQLLLPLRHLAYGGNVLWHEQGMRFSWRVMLRAKGGSTTFLVRPERGGRAFFVNPRDYLNELQESEMSSQPDLIVQLAHHIAEDYERRGFGRVEVRAESRVSLNGRRSVPFIDPNVDLTRVSDGLALAKLVLPPPREQPPATRPVL